MYIYISIEKNEELNSCLGRRRTTKEREEGLRNRGGFDGEGDGNEGGHDLEILQS